MKSKKLLGYAMHLDGKSYQEIAFALNIKYSSVKNMSSKEGWKSKARQQIVDVRASIFERLSGSLEQSATTGMKIVNFALSAALAGLEATNKRDCASLLLWIRLAREAAQVQQSLMPTFQDDLAKRIADDLEEIKKKGEEREVLAG